LLENIKTSDVEFQKLKGPLSYCKGSKVAGSPKLQNFEPDFKGINKYNYRNN